MESVARKGRRHDPFVMRLVQRLVYGRVVQAPMYPVDKAVGERDEERELHNVVPQARSIGGRVVHLGVASDFENECRKRPEYHDRDRAHAALYLQLDLVLEVARMLERFMVEDVEV
ncbi:hypothetical protein MRB53_038016 [Persea americana]|nr:hypothetical protein MRB53_038016 [Persea americana]